MAVIFPDIEPLLVTYLTDAMAAFYEPGEVRVGTKKLPADSTKPTLEVVLTAAYNGQLDVVRHEASVVIDCYGDDYEQTSTLGLRVGALIADIPRDHIKRAVVILGPVRTTELSGQERRSITADLVVKGENL